MTNQPVISVDELLAPVPGGRPTGPDLRADPSATSPYRALKAARNDARLRERRHRESDEAGKGNWSPVLPGEWKPIRADAMGALAKSKDLELVGWLLEALVRTEGFPGLRDGLLLAQRLVEAFWQDLHPALSANLEDRLLFLTQLCGPPLGKGTLEDALDAIPLTATSSGRQFARWHHRSVEDLERRPADERQRRVAAGALDPQELRRSHAIAGLREQVQECIDGLDALVGAIEQATGTEAVKLGISTSGLEEPLGDVLKILESYPAEKTTVVQGIPPSRTKDPAGMTSPIRPDPNAGAQIRVTAVGSRIQALKQLELVAGYFASAEPHSPLSHALLRIVKWGSMQFPELIDDLLGQSPARDSVFRLVGVDRSRGTTGQAAELPTLPPSLPPAGDANGDGQGGEKQEAATPPWLK